MELFAVLQKTAKHGSFFIPEKEQDTPRALKILSYCEMHFVVSPEISGISEVLEGNAILNGGSRSQTIQMHGIVPDDHIMVSDIENQIIHGSLSAFESDSMTILLGNRIAQRLMLKLGDRVTIQGGTGNLQLRVAGLFETGVSQIDKNRAYIHLSTSKAFLGKRFSGSIFQLSMFKPEKAPKYLHKYRRPLVIE